MNKKAVFLDIDGTLVGFDGVMPDSTIEAIQKAKENGHHMVICSGRSRFQIHPSLSGLGFDGIIGGAGAFVDYKGEEIFHVYIDEEHRKWIANYLEENKFVFSMQAENGVVVNERCQKEMIKLYKNFGINEKRLERLIGNLQIREDVWNNPSEEKVIYYNSPFTLTKVKKDIAPYFDVVASSMEENNDFSGEIGIANINKSTGIQVYIEHVGINREDTIAIGDGANDLEMIQYANIGVAMGNAQSMIIKVADMVTKRLHDDGIYHAFKTLGLL